MAAKKKKVGGKVVKGKRAASRGLSAQRKLFVSEYLKDLNATQAAIRAGYSPKTARSQGQRLLTYVDIETAIAAGQRSVAKRNEVTLDRLVQPLLDIIDLDLADIQSWQANTVTIKGSSEMPAHVRRALLGVDQNISQSGKEYLTAKLPPKLPAIALLAKLCGFMIEKKDVKLEANLAGRGITKKTAAAVRRDILGIGQEA